MTSQKDEKVILTRLECNIMRGFAIIAIVSNNFSTWLSGVIGDNEFGFDYSQVEAFLSSLRNPTGDFLMDLLAFYSPFGVMLFIFLSGYGLTLKYEGGHNQSAKQFIADHYQKLFLMQLKGVALFLAVILVFNPDRIVYFKYLIGQLLMVENLNPTPKIIPGPYWSFGMIMEVYIIFRLLLYRRPTWLLISAIFLSILTMAFVEPNGSLMYYLRYNFFMAILPFGTGMLVARYSNKIYSITDSSSKCTMALLLFFILLTACKFNFYSWLFMPLFIIGVSIPLAKLLNKIHLTSEIFCWLGGISGVMFLVHPILREVLIERTNTCESYYGMFLVYVFLTISLSMILKPVFIKKG